MEEAKVTISKVLKMTAQRFQREGIISARLDAEVLLSSYLKLDRAALYRDSVHVISDDRVKGFLQWLERRLTGEPVAYITGKKEFWSLEFAVSMDVLIPRPETELLVEEVLTCIREEGRGSGTLLEIGTGSGAVSVALSSEVRNFVIYATDRSREALIIAKKNARKQCVDGGIFFLCGHLFDAVGAHFDFVVSNPPYISEEDFQYLSRDVRDFEPRDALVAGPDGVEFHREIICQAWNYLNQGGWLMMEIGDGQQHTIERMLRESGRYDYIGFRKDYAGIDRVAVARRRG